MERKLIPTLLAGLGGLLILLGALVALVVGMVNGTTGHGAASTATLVSTGAIAAVIGVIALVMTYYARGTETEHLIGGVGLLVLGVVSWTFLTASGLAIAGSVLVFFGGLVFTVEGLIPAVRTTTAPSSG